MEKNASADTSHERALVLAGGGVTGVAWELGVLVGLRDGGVDVRVADRIVGTSAGSVVGALVSSEGDFETLFAAQLVPPEQSAERAMTVNAEGMMAAFAELMAAGPISGDVLRARIGAYALSAATVPEEERRAIIAARLPIQEWPARPDLKIVAVDAETGEPRIFDRATGVALADAVAASCAVPGVWPPVGIEGRRYMDGGMRSTTNADLAQGYARILLLCPLGLANMGPLGNPTEEVAELERAGSMVRVVTPDTASVAAIGPNVLDPAYRAGSARAGRAQGQALAGSLRAFWQGT